MADEDASSVRVAVRVRPLSGREKVDRCDECVSVLEAEQQVVMGKNRSFTYDYVFGQFAQQSDIWRCVEPLTRAVFDGYNATIFAYGQTGSGKTFTMGSASSVHLAADDYGIIPRVISHIFDQVDAKTAENPQYKAEVRVRFLEIYGEEIRDLLVAMEAGADSKVTLREGEHGEVQVAGATEEAVESGDDCLRLLERGSLARTTGSTLMNATSSRSHAIFTVSMVQQLPLAAPADGEELPEGDFETRRSYFNFVDLAGSERQKRTQAEGKRLKEGIDINKGLLALGNVISALGDDKKRGKVHVPYRDSKLTRMLQDSLGGNSRTLMLTCVSPADVNFDETLNALKYANRARNIKNKPVVNRDEASALTLELRRQVEMLQAEVLRLRNPGMSDSELNLIAPVQTLPRVQTDFESYASMRARAENAESEVTRLTAELKRNKTQLDCMKEEVFTAQSERDVMRMDREQGGVMSPEEQESNGNIIKDYLRTIDELQGQLALVKVEKERAEIGYNNPVFTSQQGALRGQSSAVPLPSFIEDDVKDRAELIASLEKDIELKRKLASKKRTTDASEDSADASDGTLDGSADDEFPIGLDVETSEEEVARLRVFENRQRHLGVTYESLSTEISEKERVYKSLMQAQTNFAHMQTLYEQKLTMMGEETLAAQAERDKLAEEIRELEHKIHSEGGVPVNDGRFATLTKTLKAKDEQLEVMRQKKREMDTLINKMKSGDERARRMKSEIESMKRQKVDLKKQMQDERKRYMEEAKQRAREIQALKRSQQRDKQQIAKLGSQKEAQERVLKRKMEEVTATKQKLKLQQQLTAQARRMNAAHGRKPSTMKKAERDAKWLSEEVKKRAEEQRKLEQLQREREAVAKEMETLYAQRNKLEEELRSAAAARDAMTDDASIQPSPVRRSKRREKSLSPEEEQLIFDLEEQIEACQARLEYKEEKISEIADDGNAGSSAALLKIANAQSLSDMRTMLKTLFGTAIEVKKEDTMKEQELAKLKVEMAELTARLEQEHNKSVQIKQSYEESLRRVVQSSTGSDMMDDEEPLSERSRILLSVSEERNSTLQKKCEELEGVYKSTESENQQLKSKRDQDERKLLESRERIIWLEEQLEKIKTHRPSNQSSRESRNRVHASAARAQSLPNVRDKSGPAEFGPASWANEQDDDDDGMESGDQGDPQYDEDVVMGDENDDGGAFHATFPGRARREYRVDVGHLSDDIDAGPRSLRGRQALITSRRNEGEGDDGDDSHQYYRSESPTVASDDASSTASIFSRLANPTNFTGIHKNRVRESVTKRELLQRTSDQKRSRRLKDRGQMRPPRAMTPTERSGSGGSFTFKAPPKKSGSILEVLENIKRENESERLVGMSGLRQPTAYGADRSREHSGDDGEGSFGGSMPPPAPADVYSRLAGQYTASAQNKLKQPQSVRRVKHGDGDSESATTPSHASASASHFDDGDDEFVDAHDELEDDYDPLLGGSSSLVSQVHADYRERLSQRGKSGSSAEV